MPSPTCLVNSTSTVDGVDVTATSTVTIQLSSLADVNVWSISCIGTDETNVAATINSSLSINQTTKTATFTAPAVGSALIFQSVINNGLGTNRRVDLTYTTTFGIYVLASGGIRVGAVNETTEGDTDFGWITKINVLSRGYGPVTLGGDLSGTASAATVIKVQGRSVSASAPSTGNGYYWSGTALTPGALNLAGGANYVSGILPVANIPTLVGDVSGSLTVNSVDKVHGATIPVAGALTTGNVPQVSGTSALTYGPVNLAGGSNYITGTLPVGNIPSLVGDVSGTLSVNSVDKIHGATVPAGGSLTTGNILKVSGASALSYGALDLANVSSVTGLLPEANQVDQTMGGNLSGVTSNASIIAGGITYLQRFTDLDANHLHAWELTEASGNFVDTGSSGSKVNLTATGTIIYGTPGIQGPCPLFDFTTTGGTVSGYASALVSAFSDLPGTNVTIEAWVYSTVQAATCVWSFAESTGTRNFSLDWGTTGFTSYITATAGNTTVTSNTTNYGGMNVSVMAWHHVAVTYDGANMVTYLNGEVMSSVAKTGNVNYTNGTTPSFFIARDNFLGAPHQLSGKLSRVRLSNILRSQTYLRNVVKRGLLF